MTIVNRIKNITRNTSFTEDNQPTSVKLELTGICSLQCRFCYNSTMKKHGIRQKIMSLETFKNVFHEITLVNSINEIGLFYMGESGLVKNLYSYFKEIKDFKTQDYFTFLTTNGLYGEEILKAIPYIDSLKVSWNYKNQNDFTFKTNRNAEHYYKIIENIKLFYEECHKYNKSLALSTVLDDDEESYNEILDVLSNFYDEHYFIPLQSQGGFLSNGKCGVIGELKNTVKEIPCWSLFNGLYIDVDLNIRTCSYGHGKEHILGNLQNNSLKNIINNPTHKKYKQLHLNGIIPDICRKCLTK